MNVLKNERIIFEFFEIEKEELIIASKIAQKLNYPQLKYLFAIKNFINNNFPIIIKKEHTIEEKKLIKFLLFKGGVDDYSKKYAISKDKIGELIKSICDNYGCRSINKALVLTLAEKYLRQENLNYVTTLLEIHCFFILFPCSSRFFEILNKS